MKVERVNVTLPKELLDFADSEAAARAIANRCNPDRYRSRYISDLIVEKKQKRDAKEAKLKKKAA